MQQWQTEASHNGCQYLHQIKEHYEVKLKLAKKLTHTKTLPKQNNIWKASPAVTSELHLSSLAPQTSC